MKVNLDCGTDFRNGYINVTSKPIGLNQAHEGISIIPGHALNLDPLFKDGTITELIVNPPLNVWSPPNIAQAMDTWTKKLQTGGTLKLNIVDTRQVGLDAYLGKLTLEGMHKMLLGENSPFSSVADLMSIKMALTASGYTIEFINVDQSGYRIDIEARKS